MTHIPTIPSINAWCPNCKVRFGLTVADRKVTCPNCNFVQDLPIVRIGKVEFHCLDCNVTFSAVSDDLAKCHQCGSTYKNRPG